MEVAAKPAIRGAASIVRALEAHGVRYVFSIPGVHTLSLYRALDDSAVIQTVLPRHEQGAGYMADGYARVSEGVGVAVTITGPGVTNILTPIAQAFADSSRVFLIATNLERPFLNRLEGNLHELTDQLAVVRPVVKWAYRAMTADELAPAIAEGFRQLWTGRPRPVYLEVPLDLLDEATALAVEPATPPPPSEPAPHLIEHAAQLLRNAKRVLVFAGGGAVSRRVAPLLKEFVEAIGAVVVTSLMGKGALPEDHPQVAGAFGYRWSPDNPVVTLMERSDLTIVIGSGLGVRTTANGTMPLPSPLIHIDIDEHEFGKRYQPDVALAADAAVTLSALLAAVHAGARPREGWTPEEIAPVKHALRTPPDERTARYVPYLEAVRAALPREAIIVNDMTMLCYEGVRFLPVYEPRSYLFPRGFGTLGSSLPTAIGAKLARPDIPVVSLNGDGGFQFTLEELGVLAHYRFPVIVVIFNDSTHTAVKVAMHRAYPGHYRDVDLVNPDYVKLAAAYGLTAVRVASPSELEVTLRHAVEANEPMVIDVPIALERYA